MRIVSERMIVVQAGENDEYMTLHSVSYPVTVDWCAVRGTMMDDRTQRVTGGIEFVSNGPEDK